MAKLIILLFFISMSNIVHSATTVNFKQGSVKVYMPDGTQMHAFNGDVVRKGSRLSYSTNDTITLRYGNKFNILLTGKGELTVIEYNENYSRFYLKKGEIKVISNPNHTVFLDSNGIRLQSH